MTLNKFCPVAQGEYYNNKSPRKSQHFFPVFLKFFQNVHYLHNEKYKRQSEKYNRQKYVDYTSHFVVYRFLPFRSVSVILQGKIFLSQTAAFMKFF